MAKLPCLEQQKTTKFFFREALYQQDRWHIFYSANICEYNMMINGNLTKNMPLPFFWIIVTSETRPKCENKKMPNSQNIIVQKAAAMLPMVLDL